MMQSYASGARLRGGGSILLRGAKAMSVIGAPPPRFVICSPVLFENDRRTLYCLSRGDPPPPPPPLPLPPLPPTPRPPLPRPPPRATASQAPSDAPHPSRWLASGQSI